MEREVRAGVDDIASAGALVIPQILGADRSARDRWRNGLATMADFQAQGKFECRGAACGIPSLGITGERIRTVQEANGIVVMSAPLEAWR